MPGNVIHIKNMVCNRCKMVVEQLFERLNLPTRSIELGDPHLMGKQNLSDFLSDRLHTNYATLSTLFSTDRGITIERYCILQKIERVKELLIYDELTISEIAYRLHYSSAAHLSAQFKSVTGMSPRDFRNVRPSHRISLDEV